MAAITEDLYYDGFKTFSWLAELIGLPLDQLNFLITQFTALALAGIMRSLLNPAVCSPASRHAFGLVIGLALGYFTFGQHAVHLAGLPALCYVAMRTLDPRHMQRIVLGIALAYLSCIHCHRQMYDYNSYTLDITGPLMVITQKVTSLAYSVHDGLTRKESELTPSESHHAVHKVPSVLEYFSYMLHFQTLMAGPILFYQDYMHFVHGTSQNLLKKRQDKPNGQFNEIVIEPSPSLIVIKKVIVSVICGIIFVTMIQYFPIQKIKEDEFLNNNSMIYKYMYLIVATMVIRFKYYHAWIFADAICNNCGIGFNGYNEDGSPRWDLISNVDVFQFETALSLRDAIDAWNKGTNKWLRMVVYDRVNNNKLLYTYSLSAFWHGFYPGYYFTFANGAFFTIVSRSIRHYVRPLFLTSKTAKLFYDAVTMMATRILLGYVTFSFVLLELQPTINVYLDLYLAPHLLGLAAMLILPLILPKPREKKQLEEFNHQINSKPEKLITNGHRH